MKARVIIADSIGGSAEFNREISENKNAIAEFTRRSRTEPDLTLEQVVAERQQRNLQRNRFFSQQYA